MVKGRIDEHDQSSDLPVAVGIYANSPTAADKFVQTIRRTQQNGHDVFVVTSENGSNDAVSKAAELGVNILEIDSFGEEEDPRSLLTTAGREAGYSGVLYLENVDGEIDFQQSLSNLQNVSDYCISARYTSEPKTQIDVSGNGQGTDSIVAIIPAYNESDSIEKVIQETKPYVDKVIIINDASSDATEAVASKHADGVITHKQNTGVGGAVHTGYEVARREGFDTVIQIDGDGQHDPAYIPDLLAAKEEEEADMVIGSRWLNGSHEDYSRVRRAGIRFFTFEANVLGGLSITDVTSGFRAYDVDMLTDLRRPNNSHWALEQTLEAAREGYDITEVSVPMPPATEGSQFDLNTFLTYPPRMIIITLKVLLYK
jgi:hypothetical protein